MAASYTVPVLASRFDSWSHPRTKEIFAYSKKSCDKSLREVSENEIVSHNGAFAACGGLYSSWVYPGGNTDRVKVIADFYSAWVFIDDLIDNTTDMAEIRRLLDTLQARVAGASQGHQGLDFMHRMFTHEDWSPEALDLVKLEMDKWVDCTVALRLIEAEQRPVSVDEYLLYRQTNAAMGMMYLVMAFAMPELTEEFLEFNKRAPATLRRVFAYCGITMGIVLDLYKMNADHAQVCEYSHIAMIIQRASPTPITISEAIEKSCEIFHEYEEKLGVELDEVAKFSPLLAKGMENVHAGSIMWLEVMRGGRYVKKD
ncbi:isoprenoid synthase domain-containing protein [Thelonectria olida]|uniref:Isoprenoid synthase domain-containing protein n=1 Tax=Thelonectria olida TaxID=1576542 RepID=A0A9P9AQ41_9HYPO|nr:isoprenoid synthase domain-containing protein [Thelonectria olida]